MTRCSHNYVITDAERQAFLGTIAPENGTGGGIATAATDFVEEKPGLSLKDTTMWGKIAPPSTRVHSAAFFHA